VSILLSETDLFFFPQYVSFSKQRITWHNGIGYTFSKKFIWDLPDSFNWRHHSWFSRYNPLWVYQFFQFYQLRIRYVHQASRLSMVQKR
jgi:hypothetical protein